MRSRSADHDAYADIAEAADVGRSVLYNQFGNRHSLLLEAATGLLRRELLPQILEGTTAFAGRPRALANATHFGQHRRFYRALLASSCAFGLNTAPAAPLRPVNRPIISAHVADTKSTDYPEYDPASRITALTVRDRIGAAHYRPDRR